MPAFVKTKEDEHLWAKAKGLAEKSGHKENWAYITGIFKKMKGGKVASPKATWTVSLFSSAGEVLFEQDFQAQGYRDAERQGLRLVKPQLHKHDDAEDWVVEEKPLRRASRTVQIRLPLDTVQGLDSMLGFNHGDPQTGKEERIINRALSRVDLKTGLVKVSPKELQLLAEWEAAGKGFFDQDNDDFSADPRAVRRIKKEWLRGVRGKGASGAVERLALRFLSARQSPIHLHSEDISVPDIQFRYHSEPLEEIDTGHSVEQPGKPRDTMMLDGIRYHLEQFHLHHPSEHLVDGQYYPMEMHFVHKSDSGELAVVGLFFVGGAENEPLKQFFRNLPAHGQTTEPPFRINLGSILPDRKLAYTYTGSLTTPPYTEGVHWVVFAQPVSASPEQIEAFKDRYPHNIRPPQDEATRAMTAKWKDHIPGGLADKKNPSDFDPKQLQMGIKVEQEHTNDPALAEEIAMDHLTEIPDYYTRLKKMEDKAEKKAMRTFGLAKGRQASGPSERRVRAVAARYIARLNSRRNAG